MAEEDVVIETPAPDRWRRLHRLSGAVALSVFVVEHLLSNASALGGQRTFDRVVGSLTRSPITPLIELVFIALPLGFHAGYGLVLLRKKSTPDAEIERYGDRRLWVLQRLSASLVFLFVLLHLWEFRVQRLFFGLDQEALFGVLAAHLSWTWAGVPIVALLYLFGIAVTAFHLSNGLFAATDGWAFAARRARARVATIMLGVVLFLLGTTTVICVATGTRLLPGTDADSAPCGSAVAPLPSR